MSLSADGRSPVRLFGGVDWLASKVDTGKRWEKFSGLSYVILVGAIWDWMGQQQDSVALKRVAVCTPAFNDEGDSGVSMMT